MLVYHTTKRALLPPFMRTEGGKSFCPPEIQENPFSTVFILAGTIKWNFPLLCRGICGSTEYPFRIISASSKTAVSFSRKNCIHCCQECDQAVAVDAHTIIIGIIAAFDPYRNRIMFRQEGNGFLGQRHIRMFI